MKCLAQQMSFSERQRISKGRKHCKNSFLNALMSKNAGELANLELADKTQIKAEVPKESDFVSPENIFEIILTIPEVGNFLKSSGLDSEKISEKLGYIEHGL